MFQVCISEKGQEVEGEGLQLFEIRTVNSQVLIVHSSGHPFG